MYDTFHQSESYGLVAAWGALFLILREDTDKMWFDGKKHFISWRSTCSREAVVSSHRVIFLPSGQYFRTGLSLFWPFSAARKTKVFWSKSCFLLLGKIFFQKKSFFFHLLVGWLSYFWTPAPVSGRKIIEFFSLFCLDGKKTIHIFAPAFERNTWFKSKREAIFRYLHTHFIRHKAEYTRVRLSEREIGQIGTRSIKFKKDINRESGSYFEGIESALT